MRVSTPLIALLLSLLAYVDCFRNIVGHRHTQPAILMSSEQPQSPYEVSRSSLNNQLAVLLSLAVPALSVLSLSPRAVLAVGKQGLEEANLKVLLFQVRECPTKLMKCLRPS
jgi:hypothetical protein